MCAHKLVQLYLARVKLIYVKLASFPLLRVTYTSGTKSASIVLEYLSKGDLKHFLTVSDVILMDSVGVPVCVVCVCVCVCVSLTGKSSSYKTAGEVHD